MRDKGAAIGMFEWADPRIDNLTWISPSTAHHDHWEIQFGAYVRPMSRALCNAFR